MPPLPLSILWEDAHAVAIQKPAGLAAIPGRAETTSVLEQLAAQMGLACSGQEDPRLRVVHRLDKDTSGVMLFAKSRAAQQHLSHQFQNNLIEKEYLALVAGVPVEERGEVDAPLAVHPTDKTRMTVSKHGRPARSLWQIEKRFRGLTLLRVFPKTGKTHQIRVHLQSIGLPLAIDPLYNRQGASELLLSSFKRHYHRSADKDERPLIARLTLHAEKLRFQDMGNALVEVMAPLPKDFRAALNMLEKYGRQ